MPSDESKGSQLDAIGSLAQRQLDNTSGKARHTFRDERFPTLARRRGTMSTWSCSVAITTSSDRTEL